MDHLKILNQIIARGGIFGRCAEMYCDDDEKAKQFLRECFEQCHVETVVEFWGYDLVQEIIDFNNSNYNRKNDLCV